jgi:hypothetical protein
LALQFASMADTVLILPRVSQDQHVLHRVLHTANAFWTLPLTSLRHALLTTSLATRSQLAAVELLSAILLEHPKLV